MSEARRNAVALLKSLYAGEDVPGAILGDALTEAYSEDRWLPKHWNYGLDPNDREYDKSGYYWLEDVWYYAIRNSDHHAGTVGFVQDIEKTSIPFYPKRYMGRVFIRYQGVHDYETQWFDTYDEARRWVEMRWLELLRLGQEYLFSQELRRASPLS